MVMRKLPARVREAPCFQDRPGLAIGRVQLTVAAIGIGLQDP
jgi:hypothetical protein